MASLRIFIIRKIQNGLARQHCNSLDTGRIFIFDAGVFWQQVSIGNYFTPYIKIATFSLQTPFGDSDKDLFFGVTAA